MSFQMYLHHHLQTNWTIERNMYYLVNKQQYLSAFIQNRSMATNPHLQTLLQQGRKQLDRGNNQAALETFQQAATLEPQNPEVLYSLGLTCYGLERYQEAVKYLNQALNIQPNYILALVRRGMAYKELKETQRSQADYEQAIAITPQNADDWRGRGIAFYELKRCEEAIAAYNQAIAINPDDNNAWNNKGSALHQLRRYEEATAIFEKAIALNPNHYSAWYNKGITLGKLERYEEALAAFDKAIALNPNHYSAWNNNGSVLHKLRRYEEAITAYNQAIALNPHDYFAWYNKGNALGDLGRYEEAITAYNQAIDLNPDNYFAWYNKGNALGDLGRYEEAIKAYNQVIAINPNFYCAWDNKGISVRNLGRHEEALAAFEQSIAINPDNYNAWDNKGIVLSSLGRHEEALAAFEQSIAINPNNYNAWDNKGIALRKLERYEEAIASYNEALRLTNYQYWIAWDNWGIAVLHSQSYKAAVKVWDDGIKALKPEIPDYAEGSGKLHHRKGDILYKYGKQQLNPFPGLFEAKVSYEKALDFLTFEHFPQKYMEILEELRQVCSALGDTQTLRKKQEEATQLLEELISKCQRKGDEITLRRRFEAFERFMIDFCLKLPIKQHIQALELAEDRKNICLSWLRENSDYQPKKFVYRDMQKLLNPQTAAVYWHISPISITTFIIKYEQQPIVLNLQLGKQDYNYSLSQLQEFNNWMEKWQQDYIDYCEGEYLGTEKASSPWRETMSSRLYQLGQILETHHIPDLLQDITNLILIPHKELHLLPLDYLFPPKFNITYLPSFKIGVQLLTQPPTSRVRNLVNIASTDLPFNIIEYVVLNSLFPGSEQLQINQLQQQSLITALRENQGFFHFAGHGDHIPNQPRESFLMLTETEKLTLGEIMDNEELDFSQYELICLSACETGITSSESLTDEYVGLVSGFLAKGAKYVVNSLWRVEERSTAILMIQFYQLMQSSRNPAAALREAKDWLRDLTYAKLANWYFDLINVIKEPQCREYLRFEVKSIENDPNKIKSSERIYAHPYYWAGFILTGKPEVPHP